MRDRHTLKLVGLALLAVVAVGFAVFAALTTGAPIPPSPIIKMH